MVLNFAEALIPLDDPRREKLGEHGFTKGIWPGWQVELVSTRVPAKD